MREDGGSSGELLLLFSPVCLSAGVRGRRTPAFEGLLTEFGDAWTEVLTAPLVAVGREVELTELSLF